MPSRLRHVTIDSTAPYDLALWWGEVLGFTAEPGHPDAPDDDEVLRVDPSGQRAGLLFVRVPEAKAVKNRLHLDLQPDTTRDEEVERLVGLGATLVDDRRAPDGSGWVVLADPEGNELCVERSDAERGVPAPRSTGERSMGELRTAGERAMLEGVLDWYREGVLLKVDGLSDALAAAAPVRSGSSASGLVRHLAAVEDGWFWRGVGRRPDIEPWASAPWDDEPDWEWRVARDEPLAASVQLYREAVERSRSVCAGVELDAVRTSHGGREFTVRWAYLHMLEETARHLGHLDVLRELADGATGD